MMWRTNPTQLIRYTLRIEGMNDLAALGRVRITLVRLGLIVDRLLPGEADVAAAQTGNPGPEGIEQALAAIGCRLSTAKARKG